jgi:hypothetical protein
MSVPSCLLRQLPPDSISQRDLMRSYARGCTQGVMRHKWLLFLKLCQKVTLCPGLNIRRVYAELLKSAARVQFLHSSF